MRKAVRALSGAVLVLATVTACNDDPLSEGREDGEYFLLNPVTAVVNAGDSTRLTAIVMNRHHAPIGAAVTAEPCDAKVTATGDATRTPFEEPERFIIRGITLGETCVVVRGGGVTDTAIIRVVPASVRVTGADTLLSGGTGQLAVSFLNAAGQPVTGFGPSNFTWTALDTLIATVTSTGAVSVKAPGTGRIVATTISSTGAVRADTLRVTVRAGAFTGTVTTPTVGTTPNGTTSTILFTQGAVPFDADTQVKLIINNADVRTFTLVSTGTTRQYVLPFGIAPNTLRYEILNMGPSQIAAIGTIAAGTPAVDPAEPDNVRASTPKAMLPGQTFFGTISDVDTRDWIKVTVTETGTYRLSVEWNDGSDHDAYLHSSTGATLLSLEGNATVNPETGTFNVTTPGEYFIRVEAYTFTPVGGRPSTYRATFVKL